MADSFIRLPPDNVGKRLNTSEDTVNSVEVHTQRVSLADGDNVNNLATIDSLGSLGVTFAQGQPNLDAFGGLSVSNSDNELTFDFVDDDEPTVLEKNTVGSGAITRNATVSMLNLSTTTSSGDSATLDSNKIFKYIPASGTRLTTTVRLNDNGKAGNVRRWGLFTEDNGVFFEVNDTGLSFVVRSSTSGSVVDSALPSSSWDDPLDGTGLSGITLDLTSINVWWIDYQWLGSGAVRFGIYARSGQRIVCSKIENSNVNTVPYMQTGDCRLRYENTNSSATSGSSELFIICGAVKHDGSGDHRFEFFGDIQRSAISVSGPDTYVMSVRPKATYKGVTNGSVASPQSIRIYTDQPVKLEILQAPTLTGATWAVPSVGPIDADIASSSISGGLLRSTYFADTGVTNIDLTSFFTRSQGSVNLTASGAQPIMSLTASNISAAATMELAFIYAEVV